MSVAKFGQGLLMGFHNVVYRPSVASVLGNCSQADLLYRQQIFLD